MRSPRFLFLVAAGLVGALGAGPAAAQAPIKIGEINSYSGIGAPFTGPYKAGVEMAVE
jgi:branched-chain amino acid transport system substrate-binding protein